MDNLNNTADSSNQLFKLLVIVVALFCLLFVALMLSQRSNQENDGPAFIPEVEIKKVDHDFSQLPEKFPTDIPIEADAKLTQNYNATTQDGQFQATRTFETTKTLEENFKTYENYMKTSGWEIKSNINQTNSKMLFAVKGDAQLQVTMSNNTAFNIKTVNISYTELAKK